MGIDFIINYCCPVKESLGTDKIVSLLKGKSHAETVLEMSRQQGDKRPPSEITFVRRLNTPEGPKDHEVNLQNLLNETKELDSYMEQCENCPARIENRPFGCVGYLNYPILAEAEKWLTSRLPQNLKSMEGFVLMKSIRDFEYDGTPVRNLRKQDRTFFQLKKPVVKKWDSLFSGKSVSSDQIFQMLFFVGDIQPSHACMVCLFIGMADPGFNPSLMGELMKNLSAREKYLNAISVDEQVAVKTGYLFLFLNAMRLAGCLDVDLLVRN